MHYLILLLSVFLFFACAGNKASHSEQHISAEAVAEVGWMDNPSAAYSLDYADGYAAERVARAPVAGMESSRSRGTLKMLAAAPEAEVLNEALYEPYPAGGMPQKRMVNYRGNISLQAATPEAVIDTVVERAKAKGGLINNRRNGFVSLQIPVAQFKEFFNYILTLGNVTNKYVYANDITDAYTDNATRLRIAEITLVRLQELLAEAKTQREKISLLKEIQRISEQIEQRKLEENELLRLAAFSSIELYVSNLPKPVVPYKENIRVFSWFDYLLNTNSFNTDVHFLNKYLKVKKALELKIPKDFIELENEKIWSTASALNAKLWAYEKEIELEGAADFWANAMLDHFKFNYQAEVKDEENYSLVRLQTYGDKPQVYYIAILKKQDKETLKIAQAYFPSLEVEKSNSEAILNTLKEAK